MKHLLGDYLQLETFISPTLDSFKCPGCFQIINMTHTSVMQEKLCLNIPAQMFTSNIDFVE